MRKRTSSLYRNVGRRRRRPLAGPAGAVTSPGQRQEGCGMSRTVVGICLVAALIFGAGRADAQGTDSSSGRSAWRLVAGLALIAGGASMLAQEPAQPARVAPVDVWGNFDTASAALQPTYDHSDRWLGPILRRNYADGVADGSDLARSLVFTDGRELYAGPLQKRGGWVLPASLAAIGAGTALVAIARGGGGGSARQQASPVAVTVLPGQVSVRAQMGF